MLKRREECNTWLTSVDFFIAYRPWWKEKGAFSQHSDFYSWLKPKWWLKALLSFHWDLYATKMSTDMSQVGVALFPSFLTYFLSFHLSRFSFYINIRIKVDKSYWKRSLDERHIKEHTKKLRCYNTHWGLINIKGRPGKVKW